MGALLRTLLMGANETEPEPTDSSDTGGIIVRVRDRLAEVALEKDLRRSTVLSYKRLLGRLDMLDQPVEEVSREAVLDALWAINNSNSRRATVIALRSVFGWKIKIHMAVLDAIAAWDPGKPAALRTWIPQ